MSYNAKVYREQGGARLVVDSSGSLDVADGGEIDIESGGAFKIAGTDQIADLAALGAVSLSTAELAYLDAVTIGTVSASKAVVVDAVKRIDVLAITVGGLCLGSGTSAPLPMTCSAAELNVLDGVTAGTVTASKGAVVGESKNLDVLAVAVGGLCLGSGTSAPCPLTATAAQLNVVGSVALTSGELNVLDAVTAGTLTASKAAVVGESKNLDVLAVAVGGLCLGSGTSAPCPITASAAELNDLASVTDGTVSASKAIVVGTGKQIDTLAIAVGGLCLGSGTSAGTPMTATPATLNAVGEVALTTAELVYLDAVTAGTVAAGKAVVVDAAKRVDVLAITVGGLCLGSGTSAPLAITADAAEINVLDTVTAGTVTASKAVVAGQSKNLDVLAIAVGGLCLGSGTSAPCPVTASAGDLNITDGMIAGLTWSLGAESSDTRLITAQAIDGSGANLNGPAKLQFGLYNSTLGYAIATSTIAYLTSSTSGLTELIRPISGSTWCMFDIWASSSGVFGMSYSDTKTGAAYISAILPNGGWSWGSSAITMA